jgi:hypothetical protein
MTLFWRIAELQKNFLRCLSCLSRRHPQPSADAKPIAETQAETQADACMDDHDNIMRRRIDYHQQNGTYTAPKLETPPPPPHIPTISPLMTIPPDQRQVLVKKVFKEAEHNVTKVLNIDPKSDEYEEALYKEGDRLLNVWMEMKHKKII